MKRPSRGPDKWTGFYTPVPVRPVDPAFAKGDMSHVCPGHVPAERGGIHANAHATL